MTSTLIRRVLVSNRGEIAIRIARAATGLGIESVGVHSPADALALHTRVTTESREIGSANTDPVATDPVATDPVAPYLDVEALVAVAKASGCDAVHPGYGFLAESTRFAQRCVAEGLTFIGPPPAALELFGNKLRARALAAEVGIPVLSGSSEGLRTAADAATLAREIGYPVMLKAAAGGGGRGMRVVADPAAMAVAFERCRSEAEAAFGDGTVFLERLVPRPRHIEVQVLGDTRGTVIHLHERDCSVQRRNQKVIEVAPAPGLDARLRERLLADATALARAGNYVNAGTFEFLVDPETGGHWFIECNPRIQVEHTVTEQVTGLDLVELQFAIASGASLAELGLGEQQAVGAPRGFAVQARVVARGEGTLTAYKEPTGPGIRVDGCGYVGLRPHPGFDPLLAKVIGSSSSARSYVSALDRTLHALAEFHIAGLPTNLAELRAILSHPAVRSGDARTTLLEEAPETARESAASERGPLELFERGTRAVGGERMGTATAPAAPSLPIADGQRGIESPMSGSVVSLEVAVGDRVRAGDPILILTAMKMETEIPAPCAGTVADLLALRPDDSVSAGQTIAVLEPGEAEAGADAASAVTSPARSWEPLLEDIRTLQGIAHQRLAPGSQEPGVVRQRERGKLHCRERIELLLDAGSFREVGSLAGFASYDDDGQVADFTPANHVGGWGTIDGRQAVVCADDFTSRGGHADGAVGEKSRYLDRLSIELQVPSIRLLDGSSGGGSVAAMVPQQKQAGEHGARESTGAIQAGRPRVAGSGGSFLPGHLGSSMYAEQLATVPVVNLLLGSVVGIGAAKAVLGHFSVMVRDIAQLFVAGPPVVSHAMGYEVTKEALGGWHIHCCNGSVDNLAETEADAVAQTRRFLAYLPANVHEAPPVSAPDPKDPPGRRDEELLTLIPRKRTTTYDVRRAIRLIADADSFFEIGTHWGTDQVTGFIRCNGHPLGVIASDSQHVNGGALTADGCDKLRRHLDLCDTFHIPILNLVDNPGFAVGIDHEINGTIRKGGEWMVAFAQVEVPIFTVLMRRSFGVAGNNYATPRAQASVRVAWPSADVGGIPPEGGIEAAYKRQLAEAADPAAFRAELMERIESVRGPVGPLNRFQLEEVIDPRDTRPLVCEWVHNAYRIVSQPARLLPRPGGFRP